MSERQSAAGKSNARPYGIGTVRSVLGVSRNTLLHYEHIGLIEPEVNDASGYRHYDNLDVFRLVNSVCLRNIGLSLSELTSLINDDTLSDQEFSDGLAAIAETRAEWSIEASRTMHNVAEACRSIDDDPQLVFADSWYFWLSGAERGFDRADDSDELRALMQAYPASSPALCIDGELESEAELTSHWGRAIRSCALSLVPALRQGASADKVLGNVPCVRVACRADGETIPGFDADGSLRRQLRPFLEARGLATLGAAYAPAALPVGSSFYFYLYIPVRAKSLRGSLSLHALSGDKRA